MTPGFSSRIGGLALVESPFQQDEATVEVVMDWVARAWDRADSLVRELDPLFSRALAEPATTRCGPRRL